VLVDTVTLHHQTRVDFPQICTISRQSDYLSAN